MDPEDQSQHIEVRVPSRTAQILDRRAEAAERRGRWKKRFAVLLVFLLGATASWIVGECQRERERSDYQWIVNLYKARVFLIEQNLSHLRSQSGIMTERARWASDVLSFQGGLVSHILAARDSCGVIESKRFLRLETAALQFSIPDWGDSISEWKRMNVPEILKNIDLVDYDKFHQIGRYIIACADGGLECRAIKHSALRIVMLIQILSPFLDSISSGGSSTRHVAVNEQINKLWSRVHPAFVARYCFWDPSYGNFDQLKTELGEAYDHRTIIISSEQEVARELGALHSDIDDSLQKVLATIDGVTASDPSANEWRAIGDLVRKLAYDPKSELYFRKILN